MNGRINVDRPVVRAVRLELVEMEKAGLIDPKTLGDSLHYLRGNEDEVARWYVEGMKVSDVADTVVEVARLVPALTILDETERVPA